MVCKWDGGPTTNSVRGVTVKRHLKLAICFVALTSLVFVGCQQKVAVPDKYANYNCKDGSFAIDYPALFERKGGVNKNQGSAWAKFEKGGISIRVDSSFMQSVLGDIMGNSGDTSQMSDDERPEAQLHEFNREYYTEEYRDFEEEPGETKRLPLGMTRITVFTATDGFGKIKGIRSTTCQRDKGVTFRAYCPESQWDDFKPVFEKMLDSLKRGKPKM